MVLSEFRGGMFNFCETLFVGVARLLSCVEEVDTFVLSGATGGGDPLLSDKLLERLMLLRKLLDELSGALSMGSWMTISSSEVFSSLGSETLLVEAGTEAIVIVECADILGAALCFPWFVWTLSGRGEWSPEKSEISDSSMAANSGNGSVLLERIASIPALPAASEPLDTTCGTGLNMFENILNPSPPNSCMWWDPL